MLYNYIMINKIKSLFAKFPKIKKVSLGVLVGLSVLFSLFIGYAGGRAYKTYEIKMSEHMKKSEHASMGHSTDSMSHNEKELVNPNFYAPRILKIEAFKDSISGYNIKVDTANFKFTPEQVGGPVTQNTGHIHVYVNDVKVGRGYSSWYNIPSSYFKVGENTISVTLNANNHNVWWSKKGTLEAKENIKVEFTK